MEKVRIVRRNEVDTQDELAKVLTELFASQAALTERMDINDEYNDEVEAYNDGLLKKGARNA
jgi:hypothetical protein